MSIAFYRWFPGDYARKAGHLSLLEHGVYRRLIDLYMENHGPISFDLPYIYRVLQAGSKEEQGAIRSVLEEFFIIDGPVLRNGRCDEEISFQKDKSLIGKKAATMRWHCGGNASALQWQSGGNANQSQSQIQSQKDQNLLSVASAPDPYPQCPIKKIQDLYQEVLPMLPQVRVKNAAREANIRARWKQLFAENYAATEEEGLQTFRDYFQRVAASKFLTGQGSPQPGRKPFIADLTWLMNATNFAKVIERGYA